MIEPVNLNGSQLQNVQTELENIARLLSSIPAENMDSGILDTAKQAIRNMWALFGLPQPPPC